MVQFSRKSGWDHQCELQKAPPVMGNSGLAAVLLAGFFETFFEVLFGAVISRQLE